MMYKALSSLLIVASAQACINETTLVEATEKRLNISGITLSPSIHGGDNKVFFIKKQDTVLAIAKCYTKRTIQEVERIYQLSDLLSKELPIPRTLAIFLHDQTPVSLQIFLPGQHYENLSIEQRAEVAKSMAKMHTIPLQSANRTLNIKEFDYDALLKLCPNFPEHEYIKRLYQSLDLNYLNGLPQAVIHGDFSGSNILFQNNTISGIIDLDHARYSYRLTDIARAQVFFAFNQDGTLQENTIKYFLRAYAEHNELSSEELINFYTHLKILLIKIILETYYYVEVKKEVSPEIFKTSSFNKSWQLLLKMLHALEGRSTITL